MPTAPDTTTDQLLDLLDREKQAILAADFDALGCILAEKEALMPTLSTSPEKLPGLRDRAARNGRLLEAAMAGLRSAQKRLAILRDVGSSLSTYTKDGSKSRVETGRHAVEKKV